MLPPEISRTRLLAESAMKRFPAPSRPRPRGRLNCAPAAGPPSPEKPEPAAPASVETIPLGVTRTMREYGASAAYRLPDGSAAIPQYCDGHWKYGPPIINGPP